MIKLDTITAEKISYKISLTTGQFQLSIIPIRSFETDNTFSVFR